MKVGSKRRMTAVLFDAIGCIKAQKECDTFHDMLHDILNTLH